MAAVSSVVGALSHGPGRATSRLLPLGKAGTPSRHLPHRYAETFEGEYYSGVLPIRSIK
jgi:hypothetical protein